MNDAPPSISAKDLLFPSMTNSTAGDDCGRGRRREATHVAGLERLVVGRIMSASATELTAGDGRSTVVFQRSQGRICHILMP